MPIWVVWFIYDFKLAFLLDVEWLLSRLRTEEYLAFQGENFPLGKHHQRIRLKFHVLKLGTWAAGEASVLQEVKVTSWK